MLSQETINQLIQAAGIKEQELVLLHFWGEDSHRSILHKFELAIAKAGAQFITIQQSRLQNQDFFNELTSSEIGDAYYHIFDSIHTVLDIFMYQCVIPGPLMSSDGQEKYKKYMKQLFGILTQKEKFLQIRIPTEENAENTSLPKDEFIKRMEHAYDIDYKKLKEKCIEKIKELEGKNCISILTGKNARLDCKLNHRKWIIDAGDGDLPCGEFFIAPIETATNGQIFFPELYLEDGYRSKDVTLTIQSGKIINADQKIVTDFLNNLPENGSVVCEIGFGMNPNIVDLCGYPVLDEKMAGTFHIGIGDNKLFGGTNASNVHIDLVNTGKWEILFEE